MLTDYVWIFKVASRHFIYKTGIQYHRQHAVAWILRAGYPWVIINFLNRQHIHSAEQKDISSFKIILHLHKHTGVLQRQRNFRDWSGEVTISTTFLPPQAHFSFVQHQPCSMSHYVAPSSHAQANKPASWLRATSWLLLPPIQVCCFIQNRHHAFLRLPWTHFTFSWWKQKPPPST